MSFLSTLFGGTQAKAATEAAGIQSTAAKQAGTLANTTTNTSLASLEAALQSALGEYSGGAATATGALQPYATAGTNALEAISSMLGLSGPEAGQNVLETLMAAPGYQFGLDQGYSALERARNAGGRLYGGGTLKAAQEYGQGYATNQMGSILDRISGLVTGGQSAATGIGNIATGTAANRAGALLGTAGTQADVRNTGLGYATGAINDAAAAQAGGVIGSAQEKSAGVQNILDLIGGIGKFALGGTMTNPFARA